MEKQNLKNFLDSINLSKSIEINEIPNLDLYMDQVITLFESNLLQTKRNEEDKLLTKTMINNYTKDKLLMNAKKKKYTKEHVLLMIFIYFLKQNISINDIKSIMSPIVKQIEDGNSVDLEKIYIKFLDEKKKNEEIIKEDIISRFEKNIDDNIKGEEKLLYIMNIIDMANGYKRIAEKLIDVYLK